MSSRGFSLIELLVVVAVGGLLSALALAPNASLSDKAKFETDKVNFRDLIQNARNRARTKQECVTVTVSGQTVTVAAYAMSPPCTAPFSASNLDTGGAQSLTFDTGVILTNWVNGGTSYNPLIFNQQGGDDFGVSLTCTLTRASYFAKYQLLPLIGQLTEL